MPTTPPLRPRRRLLCAARHRRYQCRDRVARGICAIVRQLPTPPARCPRSSQSTEARAMSTRRVFTRRARRLAGYSRDLEPRHSMPSSASDPAGQSASDPASKRTTILIFDSRLAVCPQCTEVPTGEPMNARAISVGACDAQCPSPSYSVRSPRRPYPAFRQSWSRDSGPPRKTPGEPGLRYRLPLLGRVEIVAASVGVELAEQPALVDHLGQREAQSPGSHAKRQASSAFARAGSGAASCPPLD
jgi:hypothetical protein